MQRETMKAAAAAKKGDPQDVVHVEKLPMPDPDPGEVLIEVQAAGVGIWDPALVSGEFNDGSRRRFPRVYGADGAGTVVKAGSKTKRVKAGDRVYGYGFGNKKGGFFAEFVAIPEENVALLPEKLSFEEGGALAVSGLTALEGLLALKLAPGDALLLAGASGGVGHVALQLAKRMELKVFAIASGADGVALCKKLGADAVVDGKSDDVVERARSFSESYRGALVLAPCDDELAKLVHGRIAHPNGSPAPKGHKGARVVAYDGEPKVAVFEKLNELIGKGDFHVEVSRVYSLEEAPRALRDVQGHHVGKLAIKVH